ncbi:MAG: hypothetical protein HGB02_09550 [Chlorobiaceae bacterium]|nr:hypothetical protein [Chlorobiaceae bacterium]
MTARSMDPITPTAPGRQPLLDPDEGLSLLAGRSFDDTMIDEYNGDVR